jgi:CHAT domain-containing protein
LVILATCSPPEGRPSVTAGRDSLAAAFLAAGARTVVASLWEARDGDAFTFATGLHRALAEGGDPATALGRVRGRSKTEGWPASSWGGWLAIDV